MSNAANNHQIVDETLTPIIAKLTDKQPLHRVVGMELEAAIDKNFDTEGTRLGTKWQELKPSTIKQKRKKNRVQKILKARGDLHDSITSGGTENYAFAGTNKRYGAIHNYGGEINISARNRKLRFRTDAKGNYLRQNVNPNLVVFASKKHKRVSERSVNQGSYKIKIPKREFLKLADEDYPIIKSAITRFLLG